MGLKNFLITSEPKNEKVLNKLELLLYLENV